MKIVEENGVPLIRLQLIITCLRSIITVDTVKENCENSKYGNYMYKYSIILIKSTI